MASSYVRLAFGIVTTLILTPLIVSKLGSEALGLWALTNAIAGYFSLTDLGITAAAIKYISHYRATQQWEELNKTIGTSFSCFVCLAMLVLIASLILSQSGSNFFHIDTSLFATLHALILILGIVAAIGFLTVIPIQCAIASQRQDLLNTWMLVVQVVSSVASLACIYSGCGIVSLGLVQIFSAVCNGIIGFAITRRFLPQAHIELRWHASHGGLIASFAAFALLMSLASRIIYFSDSVVIGHYLTIIAVAGYSVALKFVEFMRSIVGCGAGVLGTFVSEQAALGNRQSLAGMWIEGGKWALAMTLPICLLCILNGSNLISSWVGTDYPQAGIALAVLAVGITADLSQSAGYQILVNGGKNKELAILFCLEAVTNLTLSLVLVKPFGIVGVAIGTVIPQLLRVVIFAGILMPKVTAVGLPDYFRKSALPACIAALPSMVIVAIYNWQVLHSTRTSLAVLGLLMTVASIFGMYRCCVTNEQRQLIWRKLQGRPALSGIWPKVSP